MLTSLSHTAKLIVAHIDMQGYIQGVCIDMCSHENLMAHMEQSKALSSKAKPIAFLFKATKTSETTKEN
jgi:hypothetical protein